MGMDYGMNQNRVRPPNIKGLKGLVIIEHPMILEEFLGMNEKLKELADSDPKIVNTSLSCLSSEYVNIL